MTPQRPVPAIGRQRQQFTQQPPPQQFVMGGQPPPTSPEQSVRMQMQELAMEIYARLAAQHIGGDDRYVQPTDQERLRQLAAEAQTAAKSYFEALGVQFNQEQQHGS